jgi:hypothetical protein
VYTATRRPRGDTVPTAFSAPSVALPTVSAPGTLRSAEVTVRSGSGRSDDDFC